jgi:hypothetical protein
MALRAEVPLIALLVHRDLVEEAYPGIGHNPAAADVASVAIGGLVDLAGGDRAPSPPRFSTPSRHGSRRIV